MLNETTIENHLARPIRDEELPFRSTVEADDAPRCHWCEGDVELAKCPGCGRLTCVYCLDDDEDGRPRECPECVGKRIRRRREAKEARGDELRSRRRDTASELRGPDRLDVRSVGSFLFRAGAGR